jgi:hypothetical protein
MPRIDANFYANLILVAAARGFPHARFRRRPAPSTELWRTAAFPAW